MGCGTSRPEPGEEIPASLISLRRRLHELRRSRTEELRRERGDRKDSIVSTTELLRPEERDVDDFDAVCRGKDEANRKSAEEAEEEEEEQGRGIGFGRERKEGQAAAEDLPGSPSFRFYFADAVDRSVESHAVTVQAPEIEKPFEEQELLQQKENHYESLASGEGSDMKAMKKAKGRKFMALPKANFLNVRGCYSMNSASLSSQGPRMISEKAT
ncbi:hypothetical protein HPP92_006743 [Vanilla planifolia]|uniref:Uncharacterized protein n=1 Tax=Vanilla planifolia TaxID=51239 RepID=A0A835VAK9_VANPL|nr:hypothetical protein HPP92_006743 [Vanilla planifolia]